MTPRQAYVAKRMGTLVLIGLALLAYVHGIEWADGVAGMKAWENYSGTMPWQAAPIDFAPIWIIIGLSMLWIVAGALTDGYRKLPTAPTKAERLAARQAEREAAIARLERELGLDATPASADPPSE